MEIRIFGFSCSEGEIADNKGEYDDCHGEDVGLATVVLYTSSDFRSHVAHGTSVFV